MSKVNRETKATLAATRAELNEAAATIRELRIAAKQSAPKRKRELYRRETLLKRAMSKWVQEKAKIAIRVIGRRLRRR